MREFKFRAWDTKYKKFNHELFISNKGLYDIYNDYGGMFTSGLVKEDVSDRFIIQQFTGLIDSCGVDIYEGDVVEWKSFEGTLHCEPVTFDNGVFWVDLPLYEVNEVCKVRGNIFNANIK